MFGFERPVDEPSFLAGAAMMCGLWLLFTLISAVAPMGKRYRISSDDCWPLRDAAGRTWTDRKQVPQRKGPDEPNKPSGDIR